MFLMCSLFVLSLSQQALTSETLNHEAPINISKNKTPYTYRTTDAIDESVFAVSVGQSNQRDIFECVVNITSYLYLTLLI
jgi:hypothetical protein